MSRARYVPPPDLEQRLMRTSDARAEVAARAAQVAARATEIGQTVATSYQARVTSVGGEVAVAADTDPLGAAGWIEYGTVDMPAAAPLRTAAESAGLDVRGEP